MPTIPSSTTGITCVWPGWAWPPSCVSWASSSCSVGSASAGARPATNDTPLRCHTWLGQEPSARAEVSPSVPECPQVQRHMEGGGTGLFWGGTPQKRPSKWGK
ncbi:PREDICTED: uncharacterized protein LOC108509829 isoform X1 [Lepidothrix coronata]|uniref:Uncharacterized protein LOC108509829 isoform X1 n=1 Tax=Lepidothrix coronata TaxID=321398 RepID=A0A6J0J7I1_9PASS|nr:PREDICTED: uncharacterized protein LOC108509829 isoform X1 [Lepidothrix coronata]